MKRILLILYFVSIFVTSTARTIFGIEEGTPKQQVLSTLYDMYGLSHVIDEGGTIQIMNPSFSGYIFNLCEMYFEPIKGVNRFNGALFQKWFNLSDLKLAKKMRDNLLESIKDKYENQIYVEFKNEQGFTCCEFGYLEEDYTTGMLELQRQEGKDGKERIYVFLTYFAFNREHTNDEL